MIEEIKYLYAHALLHIVLKHHSRLKNRDKKLWNRSCDIVTNIILSEFKDIGKPPVEEEPIPIFKGVTAEEVYERLLAQNKEGKQKDLRVRFAVQQREQLRPPKPPLYPRGLYEELFCIPKSDGGPQK